MKKMETKNLKIMDFGRYLIGQNINVKLGMRMIANPESIGRNTLSLVACGTSDKNARRLAQTLIDEFYK